MARRKSREAWKVYGNVFDEFTNRTLFRLSTQRYFKDLKSAYKMGKEANVFLADTADGGLVIVKIYRLENCNFNKMFQYLSQDERFEDLKGQRRKIIFSWVQREYRNLLKAREAIRVPTPLAVMNNVLVTELIGDDEPAPELKDAPPEDPEAFLDEVLKMVRALLKEGMVHGDLSAFNILNHDGQPVFIDFSQGTTTGSPNWRELLERDVDNVLNHFGRLGVFRDRDEVLSSLTRE
ncbi:MAG: serine protein kinase RIO [Candidatus Woesearchaeota archaeon]